MHAVFNLIAFLKIVDCSYIIIVLPTPCMGEKFNAWLKEELGFEDNWKQNSEENIWNKNKWSNQRMDFVFFT